MSVSVERPHSAQMTNEMAFRKEIRQHSLLKRGRVPITPCTGRGEDVDQVWGGKSPSARTRSTFALLQPVAAITVRQATADLPLSSSPPPSRTGGSGGHCALGAVRHV